ncbi:ABC transporter ATP-binding protein [Acidithiobacillus marinus]|uniref:ABC transporter ATP-binding protein n=1 Tax=Acidithiobacillus marinus TaxID=187490 RepID=A0A2I1DJS4_9PROT|nr:ATP-binding cassette domain-containing protein [Acidithiobacillus marinus]PKY10133.1 ABC transporter ATP-binding protein [Acidithiobacillus marinus]
MDSPLRFHQVSKSFPQGKQRIQALTQLDLCIQPGTVTGLLGPDGAGKSTLLRLAAGLLLPDTGQIQVLGQDSSARQIDLDIGYMPQRFGLYEELTVQENLDLYADLQGLDPGKRQQRQEELLRSTALGPFRDRRAGNLSGGMKQKLGLACALLRAPRLLLLDEPTVGVDPIARRELWSIIQDLKKEAVTVLMSTAYFDEAERCDEIVLLHQGRLLGQKTPADFARPLAGRCYLVPTTQRRRDSAALLQHPDILDARIVRDGVRVLIASTDAVLPNTASWQAVAPSFEDAFVSLLGTTEQRHGQAAFATPGTATEAQESVVEVHELRRCFGHFEAVKGISFQVRKGEIFGLLGANGAGKSTTFRMLCGLLAASSGTLRVAGVDMRKASSAARARIGYVSQRFSLYGNLSCGQNLQFFASAYGLGGKARRDRLEWAKEALQLREYLPINVTDLPLGIKQRLALACALLHNPPILFLDEPTSGVDPLARREFWQMINQLAAQGVTVLITTHFMDEAEYCDKLLLMSQGAVLAQGTPAEIRNQASSSESGTATNMEEAFIRLIEAQESQLRRAS